MKIEDIKPGIKVTPFQKTARGWEEDIDKYKNGDNFHRIFFNENGFLYVIEYDEEEKAWVLGKDSNNIDGDYFNAKDFELYKDIDL